ncbi:histidine kinase [Cryomorphaceae bacterium 1068]|nr:histidine kinase [Cryomorphaceae bacterium 1068]
MEETNLINYIVITASAVVFLVAVVLLDVILLMRKRKLIAQQEIELREKQIDELIMKKEVENVNALLKGQNSERRRISQELHDRLGGILFTAKLYNSNMEKKISALKTEQEEGFGKLKRLLDQAVKEVRRISHDLYEGSVATFGYAVAAHQLIAAIEEANGIKITLAVSREMDEQSEDIQQELYALTQEMLSNTLKHAKATKVKIEIDINAEIIFRYSDNGIGFDPKAAYEGIGLKNLRNRVEKLNGTIRLESDGKTGTSYLVALPLAK